MDVIDRGAGDPVVLIPGIQGPWAFIAPTVSALARSCRVLTFSLADGSLATGPLTDAMLDRYADQVVAALDSRRLTRATICGVSFGGLVALRFAARCPDRVSALILASPPGPGWHLKARHERYAKWPRLCGPVFAVESYFRIRPEAAVSFDRLGDRLRFGLAQLRTLVASPISLRHMAERARLIGVTDRIGDCRRISAPTLVVHGDPQLDHVVPADGTVAYGSLIAGARVQLLERTGHLGSITRPEAFAELVRTFMRQQQERRGTAA
jgi:pimeloyl-ACP methyl ester carboxylesterase